MFHVDLLSSKGAQMPRALVALFGRLYDMHARDLDVEVPPQRSNLGICVDLFEIASTV